MYNHLLATFDISYGAADNPVPEDGRPPKAMHVTLFGRRIDIGFPGHLPTTGKKTPIADGLMRQNRDGYMFLGKVNWASKTGSLVLAPPYPFGGQQSNHLIFRWREGRRQYALGMHSWEPFTEVVATLRRVVASIPS